MYLAVVRISFLLFASFLFNQIAFSQDEPVVQDSVYLKNGNIITGRILNPEAEGNIQVRTSGNSVLYISESQIVRMAVKLPPESRSPVKSDKPHQKTLIDDQFNFSIQGGLGIPGGEFGGNSGSYPGFAKPGGMFQASAWVRTKNQWFWSTQFAYARNSFNRDEFELYEEKNLNVNIFQINTGSWKAIHINTGLTWTTELNTDFQLFLQAQIGLIRIQTPEVRFFTTNGYLYTIDIVKGNGFTNSLAAGLVYKNRYSASLTMLSSKLYIPYPTLTVYQPYRIFGFQLGYYLLRLS
jgi:hypothetical protein